MTQNILTEDNRDSQYRLGVGLMIINPSRKIFVGKRIDRQDAWQMPQGGIDEGEAPFEAALREMEEEIGTRNAVSLAESSDWYKYELPEKMIPMFWGGKYIGQKQKWFLFLISDDTSININTDNPEFSNWKWVEPVELPALIFPAKRDMYKKLLEEFGQFL